MNQTPESKKSNHLQPAGQACVLGLVLLVFLPIALIYHIVQEISLRLQFRVAFVRQGKFILFVYSDSPNWKSYIESNILPRINDRAIVLNWSERRRWDKTSWPVRAFEHWGGQRDFNPLAIVFCGLTRVRTIRFYRAFRDFKHGKEESLRKAESELFERVEAGSHRR